MKLKICGITNKEDIQICSRYADALGFIVEYPDSPRSLPMEKAKSLIEAVPPLVSSVVVIPDFSKARKILEKLNPTIIQLHGQENPVEVRDFAATANCQIIKACGWENARDYAEYVDMILIDDKYSPLDLDSIRALVDDMNVPIMLAGHLNPDNILDMVTSVSPYGIDAASGVEASPGKKDPELVKRMRKMLDLGSAVGRIVNKEPVVPEFKFFKALTANKSLKLITEIKPASPSKGSLRDISENFQAVAEQMENGGASAISVLVEKMYFGGSPQLLRSVRQNSALPILAKGFIVDYRQIAELALAGADAILLMPRVLEGKGIKLEELLDFASRLGLDAVVEVADGDEMATAIDSGARIIQVNTRDIYGRLDIDLGRARLGKNLPSEIVFVSASGIENEKDIASIIEITDKRVDAILVGSSIMQAPDIYLKVKELVSYTSGVT